MKYILSAFVAVALLSGCENEAPTTPTYSTPEPTPAPTVYRATPTPVAKKNGEWMWDKNRGNPLEQKPKR